MVISYPPVRFGRVLTLGAEAFFASVLLWRYVFVSSAVFRVSLPFEIYIATSRGVAVRGELVWPFLFSGCHEVKFFFVCRARMISERSLLLWHCCNLRLLDLCPA